MIIGVPKEIKPQEGRVALTPQGVKILASAGHLVWIEKSAGEKSEFPDALYKRAGAEIVTKNKAWSADLVLKVKEPLQEEFQFFEDGKIICAFFHLASAPDLLDALNKAKVTAMDYGTIQRAGESPHILAAMSKIAGRIAFYHGSNLLMKFRGKVPETDTKVTILGMGNAGTAAAELFLNAGAIVFAMDINPYKISFLKKMFRRFLPYQFWCMEQNQKQLADILPDTDILIGAVHSPGKSAEKLVTARMIKTMPNFSVAIDIAIDQGGCFETSEPTTIRDPIFVKNGVIHYCVANMPGSVPATSTPALTKEILPYIVEIAQKGIRQTVLENFVLGNGINTYKGNLTHSGLAESLGKKYKPLEYLM